MVWDIKRSWELSLLSKLLEFKWELSQLYLNFKNSSENYLIFLCVNVFNEFVDVFKVISPCSCIIYNFVYCVKVFLLNT